MSIELFQGFIGGYIYANMEEESKPRPKPKHLVYVSMEYAASDEKDVKKLVKSIQQTFNQNEKIISYTLDSDTIHEYEKRS